MTQIKDLTADQWVNDTVAISIDIKTPTKETLTYNIHTKEDNAIYGPHVVKTSNGVTEALEFNIDLKDVALIEVAHTYDKAYGNRYNRKRLRSEIRNDFNRLSVRIQNANLTQYANNTEKNWYDIEPIFKLTSVSMHHSKLKIIMKRR